MRLFLFNEEKWFSVPDIASKTRLLRATVARELRLFEKVGLIRRRESAARKKKEGDSQVPSNERAGIHYGLDPRFIYAHSLKQLLALNDPVAHRDIVEKLRRVGRVKLIIVTGVFIGRMTDRVDLLVVGDGIKKKDIERSLEQIEGDVGREISYAYLETGDFLYRLAVNDRLVRDILDYPHERIFDKIGPLNDHRES
jgi:hypothetical protein